MKKNLYRMYGPPILMLALLLCSLLWTYASFLPLPSAVPAQEQFLELAPEYDIKATKSLLVWSQGTSLEQGRLAYFYAADPILTLTPVLDLHGVAEGQFSGQIRIQAFLQAVDGKGQVFWTYPVETFSAEEFTLAKNVQGQPDQEQFTAKPISLDVASAFVQLTAINEQVPLSNALFELVVRSEVLLTGSTSDAVVDTTLQNNLPLTLQPISFSLPRTEDNLSKVILTTTASDTADLTIQYQSLFLKNWVPVSVSTGLLILLLVILLGRKFKTGKVKLESRRFKEWITEGSFQIKDSVPVQVHTLEGLVDLAIDLDKRVIHDPERRKYYVMDEKITYVHDPFKTNAASTGKRHPLGRLLIDSGVLSPEQLETALYYQQQIAAPLGESLMALGFIDEVVLYSTLSAQSELSYLELKPEDIVVEPAYMKKMTLNQARVLLALPLGKRSDGKLIVACGNPTREGVRATLEEVFQTEVAMVTVRPSVLRTKINTMQDIEANSNGSTQDPTCELLRPGRMSDSDWKRFSASYTKGSLAMDLVLQTLGIVCKSDIAEVPEPDQLLGGLTSRNRLDGDMANLLRGLDRAIGTMDWKTRRAKERPDLTTLLLHSDYLSKEDARWVIRESEIQNKAVGLLLTDNFLASRQSVIKAVNLLNGLDRLLTRNTEPLAGDPAFVNVGKEL